MHVDLFSIIWEWDNKRDDLNQNKFRYLIQKKIYDQKLKTHLTKKRNTRKKKKKWDKKQTENDINPTQSQGWHTQHRFLRVRRLRLSR